MQADNFAGYGEAQASTACAGFCPAALHELLEDDFFFASGQAGAMVVYAQAQHRMTRFIRWR